MKKIIFLLLFSLSGLAQVISNPCATLLKINKLIQEKHYQPKALDDSLSVYVFNTFLEKIDDDNTIFLQDDINLLKKHKLKIDNYIKEQKCDFLNDFFNIYSKAIDRQQNTIATIIKEPFLLSSLEKIKFSKKRFPYSKNTIELKKVFKKRLLFEILSNVAQKSNKKDSIIANFSKIAESSKIEIFENYSCKPKTITKDQFDAAFINTFCSYFDPHTMFFSNSEKTDFLSGLSSTNYSFGFGVSVDKNNILTINEITPFGAAYFSNKIEVGDQITHIKVNGQEFGIKCNSFFEADNILNANETKKATFTLRKNTGEIYSVELFKQLMADYYNTVYSYVLETDDKKTGYMKIPSFYSKFENGKTNVSDDVKKEIVKLKTQKISRLIIDLEDNTGGSLQEAITLCGFFISSQVVAQQKMSKNQIFYLQNESLKPIFEGSVVVLINGNSASASEFFANAMQDYNVGLVVGTKSYGKASIQEIFELENESKDFLKMTIGTFFRVSGKSNQKIGITPTITIPTIFENQLERENKSKTALKTEIIKGYIDQNSFPFSENEKNVLKQYHLKSQKNETYLKINLFKKKVNDLFDNKSNEVSLNINSVFAFLTSYKLLWKELEQFSKTEYDLRIFSTTANYNTDQKQENLNLTDKIGIKNIKTNFTIYESLKILNQMN
ncbi:MAG: hypothetical protein H7174_13980 [Flavobacterium sp.]|nr:hypothetical protein [Flavobacterium sp.]